MRTALALVGLTATGCLVEDDPVTLVAERAGVSVDCGVVDVGGPIPQTPGWARACALAARGRGEPFRVVVDQLVADGRDAVGWVGEPTGGGWRLDYQATYGMFGGDTDCVRWRQCAAIVDRGVGCGSLDVDLCLRCEP